MIRYILLILLWGGWCFLHSFMITPAVINLVRKRFKKANRYYRIFYNLAALVTLIPVMSYYFSMKGPPIFQWGGLLRIIQVLLAVSALILFIGGARRYDLAQFLGFRQFRGDNSCLTIKDDCSVDRGGILGIVRHPWYFGGILIVWARDLGMADILTNLVISMYFVVGAFLEERKLLMEFGDEYRDYQQRVSMLFPYKWIFEKVALSRRSASVED